MQMYVLIMLCTSYMYLESDFCSSVKLEQEAIRKEAEMKDLLKRNLVKPTKLQLLMDKMDAEARKMPRPASASL